MADFTIVGAGPVGALMGLLLAQRGHRVHLRERRPDPRLTPTERGRSINLALSARGLVALGRAGVLERVRASMITMPGRMLHDERQQLEFLPYGQNQHEVNYSVSRAQLNRVIVEAAGEHPAIDLRFHQRCVDLDPHSGMVQLRDEQTGQLHSESTQILLGADGAGSSVRGALVKHGLTRINEMPLPHDYKELAIAPVADSRHGGYAFEPRALHIWPRGGFMLIALPNMDRSFTATLFLPRHGDCSFERLQDSRVLGEFFRYQFEDAAVVIPDLHQQFQQHPQSHLGTIDCQGWHAGGRVLLIGDAAHAVVPFHGQGLNCGFEDCVVLDRLLSQSPDVATALASFERERQPNTSALAEMALENYVEMRDDVRSPEFAPRKALATSLERAFPGRFIPRYSMVTFHPEISYAEARRRGAQQQVVLERLVEEFPAIDSDELPPEAVTAARQYLQEAG
ncbi:MAG TPA: NAD(P)/FAD-dependent oxidoreductase, partial [Steroidobacteraceae bacterium]|nr:NAD(P)/FAD-dependent oxidoreductase [Steroidobacteraceae bacterium]